MYELEQRVLQSPKRGLEAVLPNGTILRLTKGNAASSEMWTVWWLEPGDVLYTDVAASVEFGKLFPNAVRDGLDMCGMVPELLDWVED